MVSLEAILLVRLQSNKHLIPFCKLTFRETLIYLFLHAIMVHDQILFEGMENSLSNCKRFVHHLDLRDTWKMRELKVDFFHIPLQKDHVGSYVVQSVVPPFN
jgi:hypothetical protein